MRIIKHPYILWIRNHLTETTQNSKKKKKHEMQLKRRMNRQNNERQTDGQIYRTDGQTEEITSTQESYI